MINSTQGNTNYSGCHNESKITGVERLDHARGFHATLAFVFGIRSESIADAYPSLPSFLWNYGSVFIGWAIPICRESLWEESECLRNQANCQH